MSWTIGSDGVPVNSNFNSMPNLWQNPIPLVLWYVDSETNIPNKEYFSKINTLGAFSNAVRLRKISIPRSVKKIGRYAFTNTQLSQVTIASDCEYYDTSFPAGCVITFYPD